MKKGKENEIWGGKGKANWKAVGQEKASPLEEGTWTILNNDFFTLPDGEITLVASIKRKEK